MNTRVEGKASLIICNTWNSKVHWYLSRSGVTRGQHKEGSNRFTAQRWFGNVCVELITRRKLYGNRKSEKAKIGELQNLGRIQAPATSRLIADFALQLEWWLPNNLLLSISMWICLCGFFFFLLKKKSVFKYIIMVKFSTFRLASRGLSEMSVKCFSGRKSHC